MTYLIIGTIISVVALGLLMSEMSLPGIVLLIVGVALGLKGRRDINKTE